MLDRLDQQVLDRKLAEELVAEGRLGLGYEITERRIAVPVSLEDAPHHVRRQPFVEPHVQKREARHVRSLDLGDDHERATVTPALRDQYFALGRHAALRAAQPRVP